MFLFGATAATFVMAISMGIATPDVMRPASRMLLAITALGIAVLWPMVRLSQLPDPHPISGAIQDLIVVLIPTQAVVWPQWLGWLGRWPVPVVGALAAMLAAWAFLVGGLLVVAQAGMLRVELRHDRPAPSPWSGRTNWMALFVGVTLCGALGPLVAGGPGSDAERIRWMFSPITAVFELTRNRAWTGTAATVTAGHWWAIAAVAAAGVVAWAVGIWRVRGLEEQGRLHYGSR
jgi:hypothetical protein